MFGLLSLVPKHQFFGVSAADCHNVSFFFSGNGLYILGSQRAVLAELVLAAHGRSANCQYQWWWTTLFWWRGVLLCSIFLLKYISHDGSMVLLYMVLQGSHQQKPSHVSIYIYIYIYHTWILWVWDMVACQCCSDRSVFFFTYARLFCIALAAQLCQVTAGLQRGDDAPSPPEVLWADEESTIPIGSMYGICEWWFYGGLMVIKW